MRYILLVFVAFATILLSIISFSDVSYFAYGLNTQKTSSMEKQSQPGYIVLATNIINDSGGTKFASDFTINMVGNSFILGSFQAIPARPKPRPRHSCGCPSTVIMSFHLVG